MPETLSSRKHIKAPVNAERALFIKLGEGGRWESGCLRDGTLQFGYQEIPHEVCVSGDWLEVERLARGFSKDKGAATRHVNQVREFYEANDRVLWITFHSDRLWWCFSDPVVTRLTGNEKARRVIGAWSDCDINGEHLLKGKLSGRLLAVQKFQGTICSVSELDYLLHKINGTVELHVAAAQKAFEKLQEALVPIIRNLHENDLEILTDLVFRQAGWQRVGVSGGTEKDIDLDLISPVTGERIAVQVKSKAKAAVWRAYREKYADMRGFSRFYFVTHSPDEDLRKAVEAADDQDFVFWGVDQLASQVVRGGLTGWLLDKAA
ncbi:MAG: hypothetical protein IPG23_03605 [Burkholderiales bacterium]|nr:hypothetical protein [Burkholderiales bacterium]